MRGRVGGRVRGWERGERESGGRGGEGEWWEGWRGGE